MKKLVAVIMLVAMLLLGLVGVASAAPADAGEEKVWVCKMVGQLDDARLSEGKNPIHVSKNAKDGRDGFSDAHPSFIVDGPDDPACTGPESVIDPVTTRGSATVSSECLDGAMNVTITFVSDSESPADATFVVQRLNSEGDLANETYVEDVIVAPGNTETYSFALDSSGDAPGFAELTVTFNGTVLIDAEHFSAGDCAADCPDGLEKTAAGCVELDERQEMIDDLEPPAVEDTEVSADEPTERDDVTDEPVVASPGAGDSGNDQAVTAEPRDAVAVRQAALPETGIETPLLVVLAFSMIASGIYFLGRSGTSA